mgnify:CR=1 FL=1
MIGKMKFHRIGIAKRLIIAQKYERAKSLLRSLADKNNAEAQLLLGYLYYGGDPRTTAKDSLYWLRKSADNRNAEAIALLASTNVKQRSWRISQESRTFLSLTLKAANMGSAESQNDLALMLLLGMGGGVDVESAIYWYKKSASDDCNVPYAQWAAEALSRILDGEPDRSLADPKEAEFWRNRARYLATLNHRPHPNWFYR